MIRRRKKREREQEHYEYEYRYTLLLCCIARAKHDRAHDRVFPALRSSRGARCSEIFLWYGQRNRKADNRIPDSICHCVLFESPPAPLGLAPRLGYASPKDPVA